MRRVPSDYRVVTQAGSPRHSGSGVHLSVVATSRNDDHGDGLLRRMQHFVDGLVEQSRRHRLSVELILVEWNPPPDRPPLADALSWPADSGDCAIRIITVPGELHARLKHGDRLPLFQMIAKNVGIRRARGRYVLATNIDILFSDGMVGYLRDRLLPGRLYRADRCDVPTDVPLGVPFPRVLDFCHREMFRINARGHTLIKTGGRWVRTPKRWPASASFVRRARAVLYRALLSIVRAGARPRITPRNLRTPLRRLTPRLDALRRRIVRACDRVLSIGRAAADLLRSRDTWVRLWRRLRARGGPRRLWLSLCRAMPRRELFTNASGDFTLLSREDWFEQRGYPEWEIFSWHLDSVLLYQANRNGVAETYVGGNRKIFHIEHGSGSGYTPEGATDLFERLDANGTPYLTWTDFQALVAEMDTVRASGQPVLYNPRSWGLADHVLPEILIGKPPDAVVA